MGKIERLRAGFWGKVGIYLSFQIYFLSLCNEILKNWHKVGKKRGSVNPLLIGAAAFAAWYFWTRANTLKSLIFNPVGLGVQGAGISLQLEVENPTSNSLQFNGFAGSLTVNGSNVGNVTDFQPVLLAPGSTRINLFVSPNVFGIASGVIGILDGNEGSGNFQSSLNGTANVNGIPLPVNINFT